MSANPSIVPGAVTGYPGYPGETWLMCLYENKASQGYTEGVVKFLGGVHDIKTNICTPDEANARIGCTNTTAYGLKNRAKVVVNLGTFDFGCLQSFGCAGGDNCVARTCTSFGNRVSFETQIPIVAPNTSLPATPGGLAITPGNGELTISWNAVPDPTGLSEVFAYYVAIFSGGNPVISGYTEAGLRRVTIGGLTNGTAYSVEVGAVSHNSFTGNPATGTGTPAGVPKATIFNYCWGAGITSPCPIPPVNPPVTPGQILSIIADISNSGPSGRVRGVIKAGGATIADKETTLGVYPSGGLFSVSGIYTMPNNTVTVVFEAYGWDGSKWVLTHTLSQQLVPQQVNCTGLSLDPLTATIKQGDKVTFKASATPAATAFDVQFKDRSGALIGTCRTSGGTCQYIWDSTGKSPGTYYIRAYVPQGGCTSLESSIVVSPPINQWNVNVYVKDSVTNAPVEGATVVIRGQGKATDASGFVRFRVDEGTIDITISKTGYNTFTTAELVYSDKTFNYLLPPVGIAKGNIHFVSVPSGADVTIDGYPQGAKTEITINEIPAGKHDFMLTLPGYNKFTGPVTVLGGSTVEVYAVLTPLTPDTGSLYINSIPGLADVTIDGQPQDVKTPVSITDISVGDHEVKLIRAGYQDYTETVKITAGTTKYLNVTLTVLPGTGTLEISSTPSGARVFIDGADTQKITPATITNLSSGSHTYKLVLSEYMDATGTFTIEPGMTTTVSAPLTKTEAAVGAGTILGITILGVGVLGAVIYTTRKTKYSPTKEYPLTPR